MSAIIAGGIAGLIAFLLAQGFTELSSRTFGGITSIFGKDRDGKPFKVSIKNEALANPQFDIVELDTGVTTKRQRSAQYEINNEGSGDKRIFSLSIVPDTTFKGAGQMVILLNETKLFPITDPKAGMFANVSSLNIPIPSNYGLKIREANKLEVFIWAGGVSAKVNFAVFIGNII